MLFFVQVVVVVVVITNLKRTVTVKACGFFSVFQALNDAKRELRYLLVYLHGDDHQDTDEFCRCVQECFFRMLDPCTRCEFTWFLFPDPFP